MPERKDVVVDRRRGDAGEREHTLVAIREVFAAAARQIEDVTRDMRGHVKAHTASSHGSSPETIAASSRRQTAARSIFITTLFSTAASSA